MTSVRELIPVLQTAIGPIIPISGVSVLCAAPLAASSAEDEHGRRQVLLESLDVGGVAPEERLNLGG